MEPIDEIAKERNAKRGKNTLPLFTINTPSMPGRPVSFSVPADSDLAKKMQDLHVAQDNLFLAMEKEDGQGFYDVGTAGHVQHAVHDKGKGTVSFIVMPEKRVKAVGPAVSTGGVRQVVTKEFGYDRSEDKSAYTKTIADTAREQFNRLSAKVAHAARTGYSPMDGGDEAEAMVETGLEFARAGRKDLPAGELADLLTYTLPDVAAVDPVRMQKVIEQEKSADRLLALVDAMVAMEKELDIRLDVARAAQEKYSKQSSAHFIRQQIEILGKKLREVEGTEEDEDEIEVLKKKVATAGMPEGIRKKADKELKKLERTNPESPEYNKTMEYVELLSEMPWSKASTVNDDLARAQAVLDEDHYGLEKVKEEIIEHLAVLASPEASGKAKIICLIGPPGVGKTSIGKSIAKATGREYIRVALGGINDEAEIRGHGRTYVGAMPGRIVRAIKEAGVNNPLFMLDEVDKTGKGNHQGSVDAALLEVLDPEQNGSFKDKYMDVEMDLSKVLFVCTANYPQDIPPALKDRMEIVSLDGYLDEQKMQIARRYLVPKQMKQAGLSVDKFSISDDALRDIINYHTREAGVRKLEQRIGKLCSKTQVMIKTGACEKMDVTPENLSDFLGARKYSNEPPRKTPTVGVATGLAYTEAGGDTLSIETVKFPGGGAFTATGNLQKVIDESTRVAMGVVKSRAAALGIDPKAFRENDVQIHFPAGATPKDGPSAGGIITVALASLFTGRRIRNDLAMTGEINLSGEITAIGGLAQKFQAAVRSGIKTVLVPQANMKDVAEIPKDITSKLEIIPVETIDEVLKHVFVDAAAPVQATKKAVMPTPVARPGASYPAAHNTMQ